MDIESNNSDSNINNNDNNNYDSTYDNNDMQVNIKGINEYSRWEILKIISSIISVMEDK